MNTKKEDDYEAIAWGATLFGVMLWMLFAWQAPESVFWCGLLFVIAIGFAVCYTLKKMGED